MLVLNLILGLSIILTSKLSRLKMNGKLLSGIIVAEEINLRRVRVDDEFLKNYI